MMPARKRKRLNSETSRNKAVASRTSVEAVVIIFERGPMSDEELADRIHSLPCRIDYNGPAKVSQYFVREKLEDDLEIATFRGRILNGVQQKLPEDYRIYAVVEKEQKGDSRIFNIIGSAKSFMRWEYDRNVDYQSPLVRAIDYLRVAEVLSKADDN